MTGWKLCSLKETSGHFPKRVRKLQPQRQCVSTSVTEEPSTDVCTSDSGQAAGLYSCPQDGCVRVFQRLSALERHLSLEKCTQSLERHSIVT